MKENNPTGLLPPNWSTPTPPPNIAQLNATDEQSCTALLHACKSGNVDAALALVETSGVDLEMRDDQGMTALMWTAMLGFRVIVIALLQVRSWGEAAGAWSGGWRNESFVQCMAELINMFAVRPNERLSLMHDWFDHMRLTDWLKWVSSLMHGWLNECC